MEEKELRRIIKECIKNTLLEDDLRNRPAYEKNSDKVAGWLSRSVAVATIVLFQDDNNKNIYVLANQRGEGAPDFKGYWNCPCGYLDYNEDTKHAGMREVYEETGIKISEGDMVELGHASDTQQNRQNVVFYYGAVLHGDITKTRFSKANMEEEEVENIKWIPLSDIGKYQWAFGHEGLIKKTFKQLSNEFDIVDNKISRESCIRKAIKMLENGSDSESVISLLYQSLELR